MPPRVATTPEECMVEAATEVLGGKWKLVILRHLLTGTKRFGELRRTIPDVTARMLTRQLRELEADGLVQRTVYAQVPPKVEYSVTEIGASLQEITDRLEQWGYWYRNQLGTLAPPANEAPASH